MDANLVTVSFSHPMRPPTLLGTPRRKAHLGSRNPKIQSRCRTRAILIALLNLIGHLRTIFSLQLLVDSTLGAVFISTHSRRLTSRRLNGFRVGAPREEIRKHIQGRETWMARHPWAAGANPAPLPTATHLQPLGGSDELTSIAEATESTVSGRAGFPLSRQ